jgi:hypothetical protein
MSKDLVGVVDQNEGGIYNHSPSVTKESSMSKPCRLVPALIFTLLVSSSPARAESSNSAALFLEMGAGARAAALGGAVTAHVSDATAAYWNPAGLAHVNGWDLAGTHTEWLQDIRYEHAAIVRNRGRHALAASFGTVYASDFDARDEVGNQTPSFGFSDVALGASYAFQATPLVSVGATAKYYRSSIDDNAADGIAFDLGAQYRTPVEGLVLGGAVRNLGGKVKFDVDDAQSWDLPRTVQVGAAWQRRLDSLSGSLLVTGDVIAEKNQDASLRFGTEYRYNDQFGLMFGYRTDLSSDETDVPASQSIDETQNLSFGASFERNLRFEYAFVPFNSDLGSTHRFSVGKHW